MKIGYVDLGGRPILFAPMEDVTDPALRPVYKKSGTDMVYAEFVLSGTLIRAVSKIIQRLSISDKEHPMAIRIYGEDTETTVEATKTVEQMQPSVLDINFGCPVRRVTGRGVGAGVLQNIPGIPEIARTIVDAVKIPVTVRTRLGWDTNSKTTVDLTEQLQDCDIAVLTIHGRARVQMYIRKVDRTLTEEIKNSQRMHIPVVGNGDMTVPQRCGGCFDRYGVDTAMIGRTSFGHSWIFREVGRYLGMGKELLPLSFKWCMEVFHQEVIDSVDLLGGRRDILYARCHLTASPLFKRIPNSRKTRTAVLQAEMKEELSRIFETVSERTSSLLD